MELEHISLFTGIGGIDLAAEAAGFKTILMVENNAYCQKVLKKHWPDVPIIGDIKDVTKEVITNACKWGVGPPSKERQVETLQGYRLSNGSGSTRERSNTEQPITLITGGFPCQPVSQAGKRKGKEDDRWLWPEMLRVITEVRPTWVVAENVAGLLTMVEFDSNLEVDGKEYTEEEMATSMLDMGEIRERRGRGSLDEILESLEAIGYEVQPFLLPACAVNAPHRRDRIFIVAHAIDSSNLGRSGQGRKEDSLPGISGETLCSRVPSRTGGESGAMGNSKRDGCENGHSQTRGQDSRGKQGGLCQSEGTSDVADTIIATEGSAHRERGNTGGADNKQDNGDSLGDDIGNRSEDVADPRCPNSQERSGARERGNSGRKTPERTSRSGSLHGGERLEGWAINGSEQWAVEPNVGRVASGIPSRVDRLKALGNAVVPQQIYPILKAIADIERGIENEK